MKASDWQASDPHPVGRGRGVFKGDSDPCSEKVMRQQKGWTERAKEHRR